MLDMLFFVIEHILAQYNINQLKTLFNENTRKSTKSRLFGYSCLFTIIWNLKLLPNTELTKQSW